jgi:hypothetical protein
MPAKRCKDCVVEGIATARRIHAAGRCATHHRLVVRERKLRAHGQRVEATYSITSEQYWALYESQNGKCAVCAYASGKSKRLAVDHDHACCSGPISCGKCVRGLLCSTCNSFLGRMRDDPGAFMRGYKYLMRPPAQAILNSLED